MPSNESHQQQLVRAEASRLGCVLWRNNVGALPTSTGQWMRFGLANDSAQMNRNIKSSDLIGIEPVLITPEMVGSVMGRFIAREMKRSNWVWSGNPQEKAQLAYLNLVNQLGGNGCFATGVGTL